MDVESYKKYWSDNGETLYTYLPAQVDNTKIDKGTFTFLTTCGLPSDAAPFLSFSFIKENQFLTPNQIFKIDFEDLDNYLMFGSNGSGDPICIDTVNQGEIVYLNHDNYFERVLINKNIWQFALCLTEYQNFLISLLDTENDDNSKRKFSDDEFAKLQNDFLKIDSACLADASFWTAELDTLLWERDNE